MKGNLGSTAFCLTRYPDNHSQGTRFFRLNQCLTGSQVRTDQDTSMEDLVARKCKCWDYPLSRHVVLRKKAITFVFIEVKLVAKSLLHSTWHTIEREPVASFSCLVKNKGPEKDSRVKGKNGTIQQFWVLFLMDTWSTKEDIQNRALLHIKIQ